MSQKRYRRHGTKRAVSILVLAAMAAAALVRLTQPAAAQNYPWCSNFADGAGTNCGWSTLEQCMITVQGSGGYCSKNDQYKPAGSTAPIERPAHKARKNS